MWDTFSECELCVLDIFSECELWTLDIFSEYDEEFLGTQPWWYTPVMSALGKPEAWELLQVQDKPGLFGETLFEKQKWSRQKKVTGIFLKKLSTLSKK